MCFGLLESIALTNSWSKVPSTTASLDLSQGLSLLRTGMATQNIPCPQSVLFLVGPRDMPGKVDAVHIENTRQPSRYSASGCE